MQELFSYLNEVLHVLLKYLGNSSFINPSIKKYFNFIMYFLGKYYLDEG